LYGEGIAAGVSSGLATPLTSSPLELLY